MRFNEYQAKALKTDRVAARQYRAPYIEQIVPLLGLAGESGELLSEFKKSLRDGVAHKRFLERIVDELGDILWYVSNVASKCNLSLNSVAERNLVKVYERIEKKSYAYFDNKYPLAERLPRKFEIEIVETQTKGRYTVQCFWKGKQMGDHLTDNARFPDGYRFHDVFHFAYAVVLNWSPVARRMFNRKRKSNTTTDEVEDGGRASVIDEGIAALVFSHADEHNFYDGIAELDDEMLKHIKYMTTGLEVKDCTKHDWERAVLLGYDIWRQVKNHHGGIIIGNLDNQTLIYKERARGTKAIQSKKSVPVKGRSRRKK